MYKKIKRRVCGANLALKEYGLVQFTWGNVSEINREAGYVVIKPSGVRYEGMKWEQMCVIDANLYDTAFNNTAGGSPNPRDTAGGSQNPHDTAGGASDADSGGLNPSTDTQTHLELYRRFNNVGGIAHTHSTYATAFAQAGIAIPCYGTTHADCFYGDIPCTRALRPDEIADSYELNTGKVIVELFTERGLDPLAVPGVLVGGHGPFTWGRSAAEAATNAAYLEQIARIAFLTRLLARDDAAAVSQELMDKHYSRKHGSNAYYGQREG